MAESALKNNIIDQAASKYYYVNVSAVGNSHRSWIDMRKFGFISAGGGRVYSDQLDKLKAGDKIFVYQGLPNRNSIHKRVSGYIGYGIVEFPKMIAASTEVSNGLLFEQNLDQPGLKHDKDDSNLAEYAVGVKWIKTFPSESPLTFIGIFKSRHIVCNITNLKTIEFLEYGFGIRDKNNERFIIKNIEVNDFKGLEKANISLRPITVLIGENASGKSSFLHATQLGISILQEMTTVNKVTKKISLSRNMSTDKISFRPTENLLNLNRNKKSTHKYGYSIIYKGEFRRPNHKESVAAYVNVIRGKNSNPSVRLNGKKEFQLYLANKENPVSALASGISGVSIREEWKAKPVVDSAAMRGDANLYLRVILSHLHENGMWKEFQEAFSDCFNGARVHVSYEMDKDRYVDVNINYKGTVFTLDMAASGMLQVIQVLAYAYHYRPTLLLLDEPDAHLHYSGQTRLCKALRRIVKETDTRIILATHSFQLVQEFEYDSLAKVVLFDNGKVVKSSGGSCFDYHTLVKYGLLSLRSLKARQGRKQILLTEDENSDIVKTLAIANGALNSLEVYSYNGCKNIKYAYEIANYILKSDPNIKIFLHRDRDYRTDKEIELEINLSRYKICDVTRYTEIFTQYNDVEHSFLLPSHLSEVFGEYFDTDSISELLMNEIRNMREEMMDCGVSGRNCIAKDLYTDELKSSLLWSELNMPSNFLTFKELIKERNCKEIPFDMCHGKTLKNALKGRLREKVGYQDYEVREIMFSSSRYLRNDVWMNAFEL